jgi:hypothetical protein
MIQGIATPAQVSNILNISETQARYGLGKLTRKNPALWSMNIRRPWITDGSGRPERVFVLTEVGALELSELTGEQVSAPSRKNQVRKFQHALALVDIANVLIKASIPYRIDRQMSVSESDEYVRPDVEFILQGAQRHILELEQFRLKFDLQIQILNRMHRWQTLLTSQETDDICSDIIVLFSLNKKDNYSIAIWMSALDALIQQIKQAPAFTVWFMSFSDFMADPTFDLARYRRLEPSPKPQEGILKIERERVLADEIGRRISAQDCCVVNKKIEQYWLENRGQLQEMQTIFHPQEFFLNLCDRLYDMCLIANPRGYGRAAIPWLAIGMVRYWLEMTEFADLRERLVIAISEVRSFYSRGLSSAADSLERLVWEVLLKHFGFARGGPLVIFTNIGSSEKDKFHCSGLVPIVRIHRPWEGVRETEEAASKTEVALTWLIELLLHFQIELGLTKMNKRGKSSYVMEKQVQIDPVGDIE